MNFENNTIYIDKTGYVILCLLCNTLGLCGVTFSSNLLGPQGVA